MTLTRVQKGIQDGINEGLIERTEGGYRLTQKGTDYVENMLLEDSPKGKAARTLMRKLEFMEREKLTKNDPHR